MIYVIFAIAGLLVGGLINVLADDLPKRGSVKRPHCPNCGHKHGIMGWLAVGRFIFAKGECPECGEITRPRALWVELATAAIFGLLPFFFPDLPLLLITSFFFAVLILIIVIDMENRLILHVVTFPTTLVALLLALFVDSHITLRSAIVGALTGFVFFYILYWVGQLVFGPGALGFGDVTLSMTMGAMLGFPRIVFALVLGILLGGFISLALIGLRRLSMRSRIPYGQFLAVAGMIMLIWGQSYVEWYLGGP